MYLVAGLGNPDREYFNTRHNIGFDFIDMLSVKYSIDVNMKKFDGITGIGIINGDKVILVKPLTYMNLSGNCIRQIVDFYKIDPEDVIIVHDDISLNVGAMRIRPKGSAGGHNGLKSIISNLGTEEFPRIKLGVGNKPQNMDLANYVLGHFVDEERVIMNKVIVKACEAIPCLINKGVAEAMNKFNGIIIE